MAIAFDNVTKSVFTTTFNHTVTGSDTILLVGISISDSNPARRFVGGVTYNGVAMTEINHADSGGSIYAGLWILVNPATGSNSVAVSATCDYISIGAISLTGARQSTQPDNSGIATANSSGPSKAITPVASNTWIVSVLGAQAIITTTGTQTEKWNDNNSGTRNGAGGVQGPLAIASTNSTWSLDHGDEWATVVASIAPTLIPTGFKPNKLRPAIFRPGVAR